MNENEFKDYLDIIIPRLLNYKIKQNGKQIWF
jgi:hypothetical protein